MFVLTALALRVDLDALTNVTTAQALFVYTCSNVLALRLCFQDPSPRWALMWVPLSGALLCAILFASVLGVAWLTAAIALVPALWILG